MRRLLLLYALLARVIPHPTRFLALYRRAECWTKTQAVRLGRCQMSKDEYFEHLRRRGVLPPA